MKKFFKRLLIIICLILIIGVAAVAIFLKSKLNKINFEDVKAEDIDINEGIEENLDNYTNIALLGIDTRYDTFEGTRTDCIMIISINETTNDVKIASVYRDTYLQIDGHGLDKVNHAYDFGNAPLSLSTINKNLDLDITKFVTINFNSVVSIVDAMGGVKITVTAAEAGKIPGIYGAGTYNLTGKQALVYGRIRYIDDDYARTGRMRNVVISLFEKAKKLSYGEMNKLIDELLPHVSTNITQSEILSYASKINKYNVIDSFGWPYEVRPIETGAWYAVPVTLESNVKKLHEDLFNVKDYEVSRTVKEISKKIITETGYSGD